VNSKGVQFAGVESRLQPGGYVDPEKDALIGRAGVIYLRDVGGELYAMVHPDMPDIPHRNMPALPATKLRHRKSGRTYTVENVETMTRQVRLREDVNMTTGEPNRTRWYPIDDFDVLGLPTDAAAAKRELEQMMERMGQLQAMLAPAPNEPPAPPPETTEQRRERLYAELEELEAAGFKDQGIIDGDALLANHEAERAPEHAPPKGKKK
jgi:hypothetical protein